MVFFLAYMRGWLVGCQLKDQVFPLGKVFAPQTVVWYNFFVNFFFEKQRRGEKRRGKQGLRWTLLPSQGGRRRMDFRVS